MSRESTNDFLRRVCAELGAPAVALDGEDEAALTGRFRDRQVTITIGWRAKEDLLSLHAPIGEVPGGEPAQGLALALLAANLSPRDTAGLAFAMVPPERQVFLTAALIGPARTYDAFRAVFFRLFGAAAVWQERLSELVKPHRDPAPHG